MPGSQREKKKFKKFVQEAQVEEDQEEEDQEEEIVKEEEEDFVKEVNEFVNNDRMTQFEGQIMNLFKKQNIEFEERFSLMMDAITVKEAVVKENYNDIIDPELVEHQKWRQADYVEEDEEEDDFRKLKKISPKKVRESVKKSEKKRN